MSEDTDTWGWYGHVSTDLYEDPPAAAAFVRRQWERALAAAGRAPAGEPAVVWEPLWWVEADGVQSLVGQFVAHPFAREVPAPDWWGARVDGPTRPNG